MTGRPASFFPADTGTSRISSRRAVPRTAAHHRGRALPGPVRPGETPAAARLWPGTPGKGAARHHAPAAAAVHRRPSARPLRPHVTALRPTSAAGTRHTYEPVPLQISGMLDPAVDVAPRPSLPLGQPLDGTGCRRLGRFRNGLSLRCFGSCITTNVDAPPGEPCRQPGVLALLADGQR